MKLFIRIAFLLVALTSTIAAARVSPEPMAGNWHANLQIPTGTLSLIFTITQDDEGKLSATMESPDQAPGQHIPISEITVVDGHLAIAVSIIGATIEAEWDDENEHWVGTFSQGMELPITIERGLPADLPTIEGLDGNWHATINRNGVDLRLILHINTDKHGTKAKVDSPDTMNMNITVSDLTKNDDQIGYKIAVIAGEFVGTLTDPSTITGTWTVHGQESLTITYTRADESDAPAQRLRPQVPVEPFGYLVEDITYENPLAEDVILAGTLTLPQGDGPFPAAILISGIRPTRSRRNGLRASTVLGTRRSPDEAGHRGVTI